jgi:CRP/FNR family transcriptional regulator
MADKNTTPDAISALSAVPYLAKLNAATLKAVAQTAIRRDYEASQVVFLEGEPCAGLYVIEDGWLKAVKSSVEGREQALRFVGPGEALGEISVFADSPNLATVIALEPSAVWIIRREAMLRLLDRYPRLARIVIQNLAQRAQHLVALVEDLSLRTVEARLARLLLEQAKEGMLHRRRWATQSELAARLGTVLDVLNRALHSLAEEGLIQVERHQIHILDREGLKAKAMLGK